MCARFFVDGKGCRVHVGRKGNTCYGGVARSCRIIPLGSSHVGGIIEYDDDLANEMPEDDLDQEMPEADDDGSVESAAPAPAPPSTSDTGFDITVSIRGNSERNSEK